jgi:LacI family transcriptional regulator
LAAAGHTEIAVLSPTRRSQTARPADDIAARVGRRLKLRIRITACPHDLLGATGVARGLLDDPGRPTGILALADSMAYGVYAACAELGLRIPDQLSLLGYDDQPSSQLLTPALSSYQWPLDELVAGVVDRVGTAIDGPRRIRRTTVTPTPMMRDSVGPAVS